jgi:S-DNA-T family DNA segregation ATPase FtsK/SpoIIIE
VAGRREPELVRRVLLDTRRLVDERERLFAELRIDSPAQWRQRRAAGDLPPGTRAADVFLVLDNWPAVRSEVDLADEVVIDIAARGLGVAVHVVLTANRWLDVRPNLRDSITTRLELRLNDPSESEVGRIAARGLVDAGPGRGISAPGVLFQAVLPRVDGNDTVDGLTEAQEDALGKLAAGWMGPPAPEIRTLPRQIGRSELWADPAAPPVAIGIDEVGLAPVGLDLEAEDQHLVVFGDSGAGKTQFLRTYLAALTRRSSSDHVRFLLLDYRRGLLGAVADDYIAAHAADATAAREYVAQLDAVLANRMPPPGHDPSSAGNHHWEGPEIYLVVDDYDAVSGASSPLLPLLDRLVQARDLGFHVVLARRVAGSARALMSDQFLNRIRDLQPAGLVMSGDPREGILLGDHRAGGAPPGRGQLIRRGHPATVVQTAIDDGGDPGTDGSGRSADGDRR